MRRICRTHEPSTQMICALKGRLCPRHEASTIVNDLNQHVGIILYQDVMTYVWLVEWHLGYFMQRMCGALNVITSLIAMLTCSTPSLTISIIINIWFTCLMVLYTPRDPIITTFFQINCWFTCMVVPKTPNNHIQNFPLAQAI